MTTRDTFFPFLNRAFGRARVIRACLRLVPEACKFVVGLSDRDRLKELLVRELFSGECVARLREEGRRYAAEILKWIRPAARAKVAWHKTRGHRLIMVSASLDLYLEPVCRDLGFDDLLCTRPSVNNLVFDGRLQRHNCRGPEKVRQLTGLLGDLSQCELYAYGDSAGDHEMLSAADHPNWRVF